MTEVLDETTARISEADLRASNFTDCEIRALKILRDQGPYIEYFDSEIEMQRMKFLKWRFATGDLQEVEISSSTSQTE